MKYGDRRIKFIVLIMASSGMRIEGFEYLRWGNIMPIERDGKVVAAKIKISSHSFTPGRFNERA